MSYKMSSMNDVVHELAQEIHRVTEDSILDQLNDFVSRGLIVIETTTPILIQDFNTNKIKISQSVKLTLKDKEYIVKLEEENKKLTDLLKQMNDLVNKRGI